MYTLPDYRGVGIGSEILKRLIKEGERLNLSKIELHATKAGEAVYRKHGFNEPHEVFLEYLVIKWP